MSHESIEEKKLTADPTPEQKQPASMASDSVLEQKQPAPTVLNPILHQEQTTSTVLDPVLEQKQTTLEEKQAVVTRNRNSKIGFFTIMAIMVGSGKLSSFFWSVADLLALQRTNRTSHPIINNSVIYRQLIKQKIGPNPQ